MNASRVTTLWLAASFKDSDSLCTGQFVLSMWHLNEESCRCTKSPLYELHWFAFGGFGQAKSRPHTIHRIRYSVNRLGLVISGQCIELVRVVSRWSFSTTSTHSLLTSPLIRAILLIQAPRKGAVR